MVRCLFALGLYTLRHGFANNWFGSETPTIEQESNMKSTKFSSMMVFAAVLAVSSSAAFAANITDVQSGRAVNQWQDMTGVQSTKTRAEVRSELNQANPNDLYGQQEYVDFSKNRSTIANSRAQVKSELGKSSANAVLQPGDVYFGG